MKAIVTPARTLQGEIRLPGDKSISHRAMIIGAIAEGTTEVCGFSSAADPLSTLSCLHSLGIQTRISGSTLFIEGKGLGNLSRPSHALDAGNSGTTIRLLTGILAAQKFDSVITGDRSLRQRPMKRVIDPLTQMGAAIEASEKSTAPLKIFPVGGLHGIDYELPVPSAQVKSAILLAGLHAEGITTVHESLPTRDHTERMLSLETASADGKRIAWVEGMKKLQGKRFDVPGDLSAAIYLIVAACIVPNSEVRILNVGLNPTRTAILDVLKKMGANIEIENTRTDDPEPRGNITVRSSELQNIPIDSRQIPSLIDEIPALAIAGAIAKGKFEIRGAAELRVKETDRIRALAENLRRLGVNVEEFDDGFAYEGENQLISSGALDSYRDHRIAMAMGVAGLVAGKDVEITDAECVDISFPGFWGLLETLST